MIGWNISRRFEFLLDRLFGRLAYKLSRSYWLNVSIQLFEDLFCYTKNAECINSVKTSAKAAIVCKFSEYKYNFKLYNDQIKLVSWLVDEQTVFALN